MRISIHCVSRLVAELIDSREKIFNVLLFLAQFYFFAQKRKLSMREMESEKERERERDIQCRKGNIFLLVIYCSIG
jgi:hypothetical protein